MNATRPRVALVVHQYGEPHFGGASNLCATIARRLNVSADVEVLTSCARDYRTWENAYRPGHSRIDDIHVRRFPVDRPRSPRSFDRLSRTLLERPSPSIEDQERWMRAQGPYSTELLDHLEVFGKRYEAVVFFSYLYAHSYFGLPLVEDRAFLFPLAHDEWPIHLSMWDAFFARPRRMFFLTLEEADFVNARFAGKAAFGPITGVGIDVPADTDALRFRQRFGLTEPFLLYLGRVDRSKGCDTLVDDFVRYREQGGRYRHLVLAGNIHMPVRRAAGVHWCGPLDEGMKWNALSAADALVMPSAYESLSLAVLEAWAAGTPALVSAQSAVLVGQCRRAGAGLWYANCDEFAVALDLLESFAVSLGRRGRKHVQEHCSWPSVVATIADALNSRPAMLQEDRTTDVIGDVTWARTAGRDDL